jgi:AcrR family transcriptional regulator
MTTITTQPPEHVERTSAARDRILRTASRLFYDLGVRAVGIDQIVDEANVTRSTFYRHFPSKDSLVVAYLRAKSAGYRAAVDTASRGLPDARAALSGIVSTMYDEATAPGFRGCAFLNAAAEFSDPEHPVRQQVVEHRAWFRDTVRDLLVDSGHSHAESAADELVLLRDGVMSGGYLDDPQRTGRAFLRAASDVIDDRRC